LPPVLDSLKAAVPERGRGFLISGNIGDGFFPLDERREMDEDLKIYLEGMEARLDARFEVIDRRFEAMDARLDGMDARSEAMEARLITHVSVECEKIETKMLTEFHKWGPHLGDAHKAGDQRCRLPRRAL